MNPSTCNCARPSSRTGATWGAHRARSGSPNARYRPAYFAEDGRQRPGLETFLDRHKIGLFFAETHMIEGGRPVGVAAGEAIGPYGNIMRRYVVPFSEVRPAQPATTYHAVLRGRHRRRRAGPQQPQRPAGVERRVGIPGGLRLPGVPQEGRRLGDAVLARLRGTRLAGRQGRLPPGLGGLEGRRALRATSPTW